MFRTIIRFFILFEIFTLSLIADKIDQDNQDRKINIIPKPDKIIVKNGNFIINNSTLLYVPKGNIEIIETGKHFSEIIKKSAGYDLKIKEYERNPAVRPNSIILSLKHDSSLVNSGYFIHISEDVILINSADPAGMFYAIQSLRQLLPEEIESKNCKENLAIPCSDIIDKPQFVWRGLMLDCSRTFLPKEYILKYIDLLAFYKMNILHLHLTDDQGWRLEIKKYPKLTEICSKFDKKYPDEINGYYTQADMKEIIEYAKKRYITIVPEIEMPGHSSEIFAAFPKLSCSGKTQEIYPFFKGPTITEDILCAGNEDVFKFMQDVLTEVISLFPSEYIHIGGDEAPKAKWKKCPKCKKRISKEKLKDENEWQSYFIKRIEKFVNSKGRKIIGWDEILEGGLAQNAAVMSWRGVDGGIHATKLGHHVVMSPTTNCYFDYDSKTIPLEKTYSFNPVPKELDNEQARLILGGQANMWTHIARTDSSIDSQIFPRMIALSEALWTKESNKDFSDFSKRLITHERRINYMGVKFGVR